MEESIKIKVGPVQVKCIDGNSLWVWSVRHIIWKLTVYSRGKKSISGLKSSLSRARISDASSSLHSDSLLSLWFLLDSKSAIRFCFPGICAALSYIL